MEAASTPKSKSQHSRIAAQTITPNDTFSIAFKPAESGWGAGKKYEQNYDNIFGKKKDNATPRGDETITTQTETQATK
jgi:hypothetical protein